jgi:C_GCAxxG_C_C family probable redox protein
MSVKTELAKSLHAEGCNCAQSVFGAFAEDYDIDTETAIKLGSALGGGAHIGEICGAASGAALVVAAKYGNELPGDLAAKRECKIKTAEFMDEFRRRFGAMTCRELLGFDMNSDEGHERFVNTNTWGTNCGNYVEGAVTILEELGY